MLGSIHNLNKGNHSSGYLKLTSIKGITAVGNYTPWVCTRLICLQLQLHYDKTNRNSENFCSESVKVQFKVLIGEITIMRNVTHLGCEYVWLVYNFGCGNFHIKGVKVSVQFKAST